MNARMIKIADDFSRHPGGRFRKDGPHSGEAFRESLLAPAIASSDEVVVILDGVAGLPPSFLEEAFGGLMRPPHCFTASRVAGRLKIKTDNPRLRRYSDLIDGYIKAAGKASAAS